jgi:hypothetical protein
MEHDLDELDVAGHGDGARLSEINRNTYYLLDPAARLIEDTLAGAKFTRYKHAADTFLSALRSRPVSGISGPSRPTTFSWPPARQAWTEDRLLDSGGRVIGGPAVTHAAQV